MAYPVFSSVAPSRESTGNALGCPISFSYVALGSTINLATERIYVDGVLAVNAGAFQAGFTGSVSVGAPHNTRYVTIATRPSSTKKRCNVVLRAEDATGDVGFMSYSFFVTLGDVSELEAKTWCGGKRIDLTWTNPAGTTHVKIRRSKAGYPRFTDDPGTDVYSGVAIQAFNDGVYTGAVATSNTALEPDAFYYYTVFVSFDGGTTWNHTLSAEVQGLSIKDYYDLFGDYVYDLLPRKMRELDGATLRGTNQYKLRDYCRVLQCGINLYRGWFEATLKLRDPDEMPAGRIGDGQNNYGVLASQLWDYGFSAGKTMDAATMRRLVFGLIGINKLKGACTGLVDLTKVLCTWDARCVEMAEPLCGVNHLAYSYDGESVINTYIASLSANNGIVSTAGQVTLYTARLFDALGTTATGDLPTNPPVAFVLDALGTFACVESVAAAGGGQQVITFTDPNAQLRREITGAGTAVATTFTITSINTSSYPWQFPSPAAEPTYGENAFAGLYFKDSAGTVRQIYGNAATDNLGNTELSLDGAIVTGNFSIAAAFDPAGASYAARIPLLRCKLYTGEFTLTYDSLWDIRLKEEIAIGPWSLITAFLSTLGVGWAPTPTDVEIVVSGAHEVIGVSTDVRNSMLEDSTKAWTLNQWTGYYLLPEWNQKRLFRITGNTATELAVDVPTSTGDLDTLTRAGGHYVILSEKNALRYSLLVAAVPSFIPAEMRATVKFE